MVFSSLSSIFVDIESSLYFSMSTEGVFELRTYYCHPGRLEALHRRFQDVALPIWKKYGIQQAGFFTTMGMEDDKLVYLLRWESVEQKNEVWGRFRVDPEWEEKRQNSELPENGGPIVDRVVSEMLSPTSYSIVK